MITCDSRTADVTVTGTCVTTTKASGMTEAWVLRCGERGSDLPGILEKTLYPLPPMTDHDVLAEPIYGAWEGNMTHCLERKPVDVCRIRRENEVVLGNAGVVRILKAGAAVTTCREGDFCILAPIGSADRYGHMIKVHGYDAPNMMGLLAKQAVYHELNVIPIPRPTRHSYVRWAGWPVRYGTAWENWKLSYNVWKAQFDLEDFPPPYVCGWGGAVALAMAQLARHFGCPASLVASSDYRLDLLRHFGITPIDRRTFPCLAFDEKNFESDRAYRAKYLQAEKTFVEAVQEATDGNGVSIFVDNIGGPVFRATLRTLGRLGIVTTSGWKQGKKLTYDRTAATVGRHIFLHVHGCRRIEGVRGVEFAEEHGWLPPAGAEVYAWDDIPQLAADYASGKIQSYTPVFEVNPL